MKALVLMVKPNPKAPLLAWAARPDPVSRAAFVGHRAPGVPPLSPSALYPSMHPPPAQRAGTGAKLPSGCPRGEALLSSLRQDPGPPKKHKVMRTTAATHVSSASATCNSSSTEPTLTLQRRTWGHRVSFPVKNEDGLRTRVSPDSLPLVTPTVSLRRRVPGFLNPTEGSVDPWPLSHCKSGSRFPSL